MTEHSRRDVLRRTRVKVIVMYTLTVVVIIVSLSLLIYFQIVKQLGMRAMEQLTVSDSYLAASLDYFTDHMESDCNSTLQNLLDDSYDPVTHIYTDAENDEKKNATDQRLLMAAAGKNYNDFFIIFSDDTISGKLSSGSSDLLTNEGYATLTDLLGDEQDGWFFGLGGSTHKLFYVRRVNDHSMFMLSCYTEVIKELCSPNKLSDDNSYILTDQGGTVILSNIEELEPGSKPDGKYAALISGSTNESFITADYIGTSLTTSCGWNSVLLTEPETMPMLERSYLMSFGVVVVFTIAGICMIIGIIACSGMINSGSKDPDSEFIDPLTGKLNEYGLDEKISEQLEISLIGSTYAFLLIGIKNAEQIRTSVSLKYWNDVRIKLAEASESFFEDRRHFVGRIYEDYILVFADYTEFDIFHAHDNLIKSCKEFCSSFDTFAVAEDDAVKLRISIGACIYPDHGEDFDTMLAAADEAYRAADQEEDNSFAVFKPQQTDKEEKA